MNQMVVASYAYMAEKENLRLVKQDKELLKKGKVAISIKEMSQVRPLSTTETNNNFSMLN